jgi:cytochrome c-type biogenesis protein CcmH
MAQLRTRTLRAVEAAIGLGMVAIVLLAGCDRRTKPFVPVEQEPPKLGKVSVPGLETPSAPPVMPPPRSSVEKLQDTGTGEGLAGQGPEISGTVRLADGVEPGAGILFVIARRGEGAGPPLAVRKLDASRFPVEFSIGASDVMIPGLRFEGDIVLTARLDRDGNPMTRDPADLSGALPDRVQPGATGVEIVLKRGES